MKDMEQCLVFDLQKTLFTITYSCLIISYMIEKNEYSLSLAIYPILLTLVSDSAGARNSSVWSVSKCELSLMEVQQVYVSFYRWGKDNTWLPIWTVTVLTYQGYPASLPFLSQDSWAGLQVLMQSQVLIFLSSLPSVNLTGICSTVPPFVFCTFFFVEVLRIERGVSCMLHRESTDK